MKNNCMICGGESNYFFSKEYKKSPVNIDLHVDYFECSNCNFVFSRTHQDLSKEEWISLNNRFHHGIEQNPRNRLFNQPPYIDMALALAVMDNNDMLDLSDCLDFAAGYGTLAKALSKYFGKKIWIFDEYVTDEENENSISNLRPSDTYKTVINSAMFEHVTKRQHLDNVNSLVDDSGVLMVHTHISEKTPKDPNWFYLEPIVHCAFHTNKSMQILMDQWGYGSSVYCLSAKSWFLFKKSIDPDYIDGRVRTINNSLQREYFHFKEGFVDYWKD